MPCNRTLLSYCLFWGKTVKIQYVSEELLLLSREALRSFQQFPQAVKLLWNGHKLERVGRSSMCEELNKSSWIWIYFLSTLKFNFSFWKQDLEVGVSSELIFWSEPQNSGWLDGRELRITRDFCKEDSCQQVALEQLREVLTKHRFKDLILRSHSQKIMRKWCRPVCLHCLCGVLISPKHWNAWVILFSVRLIFSLRSPISFDRTVLVEGCVGPEINKVPNDAVLISERKTGFWGARNY